jgi:hypothetical protein
VPRSTERTKSLSFGWINAPLEGETFVGNYGRAFDVIVMNRPDIKSSPLYHRTLVIHEALQAMSALGPKQTSIFASHMSAFGGKADITRHSIDREPFAVNSNRPKQKVRRWPFDCQTVVTFTSKFPRQSKQHAR